MFHIAIKQLCDHETLQEEHQGQHQSSIQQKRHPRSSHQAFLSKLLSFLGNEKSTKCTYVATGCCFIHPPLIFATQSLIISLQHITLCISLLCGHSVLPNVMKDPLLIVILRIWPTKILSILRHQNSDFYVAYF